LLGVNQDVGFLIKLVRPKFDHVAWHMLVYKKFEEEGLKAATLFSK
jgi:hypothetical protein